MSIARFIRSRSRCSSSARVSFSVAHYHLSSPASKRERSHWLITREFHCYQKFSTQTSSSTHPSSTMSKGPDIASKEYLTYLKSLFPASSSRNPWFVVAVAAYAACNKPAPVANVLRFVLEETQIHEERLMVARQLREAIFKSGLVFGYSRAINGLIALHEATPPELRDIQTLRNVQNEDNIQSLIDGGNALFESMYHTNASNVQGILDEIHPDMGWFSLAIGYGHVYRANHILSQVETSYAIVAGLISADTPRQTGWHLRNCINGGATLEEARAVRKIAMEVAATCGVQWENEVPEVEDPNDSTNVVRK